MKRIENPAVEALAVQETPAAELSEEGKWIKKLNNFPWFLAMTKEEQEAYIAKCSEMTPEERRKENNKQYRKHYYVQKPQAAKNEASAKANEKRKAKRAASPEERAKYLARRKIDNEKRKTKRAASPEERAKYLARKKIDNQRYFAKLKARRVMEQQEAGVPYTPKPRGRPKGSKNRSPMQKRQGSEQSAQNQHSPIVYQINLTPDVDVSEFPFLALPSEITVDPKNRQRLNDIAKKMMKHKKAKKRKEDKIRLAMLEEQDEYN